MDAQRNDYDVDDDGLIEIATLAQLDAVRHDLAGAGAPVDAASSTYAAAFGNAVSDMGCPAANDPGVSACRGYQLADDLDFDTDGDDATHENGVGDDGDAYYNAGAGWDPIGATTTPGAATHFNAVFDGNGKIVDNLFVNRPRDYVGLFAALSDSAVVKSLGLPNARVQQGEDSAGALAGESRGRIAASWSSGSVAATSTVGGLVGAARSASSELVAVYSTAAVACSGSALDATGGGLVGIAGTGAKIEASYSTGAVAGACPERHGLTKQDGSVVEASYWDIDRSGIADDAGNDSPEGLSTTALQTPTAYGATRIDIYSTWDDRDVDGDGRAGQPADDAWHFGTNRQHPVLKFAGFSTTTQFEAQQVDTAPAFAATVLDKMFAHNEMIAPFEVPAASGGDGALTYAASGLPQGLSFGLPDCNTERTICGTPSQIGASSVAITVSDADDNRAATDQARLTFTITIGSAASVPALTVAPSRVWATEGGDDGFYTVVLATEPTDAVTVTATSDHVPLEVDTDATPLTKLLTLFDVDLAHAADGDGDRRGRPRRGGRMGVNLPQGERRRLRWRSRDKRVGDRAGRRRQRQQLRQRRRRPDRDHHAGPAGRDPLRPRRQRRRHRHLHLRGRLPQRDGEHGLPGRPGRRRRRRLLRLRAGLALGLRHRRRRRHARRRRRRPRRPLLQQRLGLEPRRHLSHPLRRPLRRQRLRRQESVRQPARARRRRPVRLYR